MRFFLRQPLYKRALVLYLMFSFTMSAGTVSGLQVALPQIMEDFDVPVTTAAWVGMAYFVALAGGTLTLGALTKIYDGRSLVIFGLVVDVIAMTITFFTNDIYVFIVCRFISPLARVFPWLVLQVESVSGFPQEQRGKAVGYTLISQNLGLLVSLPLTGWVVEQFGWRWMFMGSSVIFALMVPLVLVSLPPLKPDPTEKKRLSDFDMAGGILMMAGTVAVITALQLFARGMSNSGLILILGVGGALALGAFVWIELHVAQPVLRFSLFKDRSVLTGSAQSAMVGWLTGVSILLLPFLFIDGFGWSVAHASNVLLFQNFARPLAGPVGGRLADRFGPNPVILPAAGITVIGQLGLVAAGVSPEWVVVAGVLLLWGTGLALMQTVNLSQIYAALPRNEMHVAPSLNLVVSTFGTTSGQAIGSLLVDRIGNATDSGAGFASGIGTAIVGISITFVVLMIAVQLLPRLLLRGGGRRAAEVGEPAAGG